jgi:hypothetical protein
MALSDWLSAKGVSSTSNPGLYASLGTAQISSKQLRDGVAIFSLLVAVLIGNHGGTGFVLQGCQTLLHEKE